MLAPMRGIDRNTYLQGVDHISQHMDKNRDHVFLHSGGGAQSQLVVQEVWRR